MSDVVKVIAYGFERVRDLKYFLPQEYTNQEPTMYYDLDVTLKIIESMVNILPIENQQQLETFLINISDVIVKDFEEYYPGVTGDSNSLKESIIRYSQELYQEIMNGVMSIRRRGEFSVMPFKFIGVAIDHPMEVGNVGIGFGISRDRYESGLLKKPQDIVMNVLWRVR